MPINDQYARLRLDEIIIERDSRQRRQLEIDAGFLTSIRQHGVLIPIIVTYTPEHDKFLLVAGERRLEASRQLGLANIPVRFASEMSPIERQLFELEENVKRREIKWQEVCQAVAKMHEIKVKLDPDWQRAQTAELCAIDPGSVTHFLTVYESWGDPNVQQAGTMREAYNLLLRRQQRAQGVALQELLDWAPGAPVRDEAPIVKAAIEAERAGSDGPALTKETLTEAKAFPILCRDSIEWMRQYEGPKFNLIHCDFPYGIGLFSSNGIRSGPDRSQMGRDEGEWYDDSPEAFKALVETLAGNLNRFFSIQGHIMFWFSNKWEIESWVRAKFAELAPSISWSRFPLIWLKSDNAGIAASPSYEPRHIYETCLLGSRGKRPIVRIVSDAYSAPTDKSIHVSAKPEPMLRHFMTMLVDESTSLLDPTCGSGTALRAAESLGASRVLGLEKDPQMVEQARRALALERAKRRAAETLRSMPMDF